MIKLIKKGHYRLIGTSDRKLMLYLSGQAYLLSYAKDIGQLISFSKHHHSSQSLFAAGEYRIYTVKDEPKFVDLIHLELSDGNGGWQGYFLLTGLPTKDKVRSRIVLTKEVISKKSKEAKVEACEFV